MIEGVSYKNTFLTGISENKRRAQLSEVSSYYWHMQANKSPLH